MRALIALVAVALVGCTGPQLRALSVLDCRVKALEPLLGSDLAEEIAREASKGKVDPGRVLRELGTLPADFAEARRAWLACVPPAPMPEPEVPKPAATI